MTTVDELKEQVPTLEEQLFSMTIPTWDGSADIASNYRMTLMIAPFNMRVLSAAMSFEYHNLAASDTNYWSAILEHSDGAGGFPDILVRTTQLTGANANGPIVARKAWKWDGALLGDNLIAEDQLLTLNWIKTGTPAALHLPVTFTVRYRRI